MREASQKFGFLHFGSKFWALEEGSGLMCCFMGSLSAHTSHLSQWANSSRGVSSSWYPSAFAHLEPVAFSHRSFLVWSGLERPCTRHGRSSPAPESIALWTSVLTAYVFHCVWNSWVAPTFLFVCFGSTVCMCYLVRSESTTLVLTQGASTGVLRASFHSHRWETLAKSQWR